MVSIEKIVDKLASYEVNENTFNQYKYGQPLGELTRRNVSLYLKKMKKLKCNTVLVGEAAGYKGCRLSGIPFTSEYILIKGEYNGFFGVDKGFSVTDSEKLNREHSASIVWQTFTDFGIYPLMWNAYPFHPYKKNDHMSNRTPTNKELEIGREFLEELLKIFSMKCVIAVGNKAKMSLDSMGVSSSKIRHPANGGKVAFRDGLQKLCL